MSTPTSPSSSAAESVPHTASRRLGYGMAVVVNLVLLVLGNVTPGWRAIPFLTADMEDVILLVNLSLIVGILVNALNATFDRRSIRAAGELVSSGVALAMLIQLWNVFPFDFSDPAVDWALLVRAVSACAMVACVVSIIVQTVILLRIAVSTPVSQRA